MLLGRVDSIQQFTKKTWEVGIGLWKNFAYSQLHLVVSIFRAIYAQPITYRGLLSHQGRLIMALSSVPQPSAQLYCEQRLLELAESPSERYKLSVCAIRSCMS